MVIDVNQILSYSNEFDIKIFLMGTLFVYSIVMIWLSLKIDDDDMFKQIVKYLILRIPAIMYLIYFPMYGIFLFNAVPVETLLIVLFSFYGVLHLLGLIAFIAYGTSYVLALFGVKWRTPRQFKINKNM